MYYVQCECDVHNSTIHTYDFHLHTRAHTITHTNECVLLKTDQSMRKSSICNSEHFPKREKKKSIFCEKRKQFVTKLCYHRFCFHFHAQCTSPDRIHNSIEHCHAYWHVHMYTLAQVHIRQHNSHLYIPNTTQTHSLRRIFTVAVVPNQMTDEAGERETGINANTCTHRI